MCLWFLWSYGAMAQKGSNLQCSVQWHCINTCIILISSPSSFQGLQLSYFIFDAPPNWVWLGKSSDIHAYSYFFFPARQRLSILKSPGGQNETRYLIRGSLSLQTPWKTQTQFLCSKGSQYPSKDEWACANFQWSRLDKIHTNHTIFDVAGTREDST
jgi:hypothetical protein